MALKPIQLAVRLFTSPGELDRSRHGLTCLMYGMVLLNREYLLRHPMTPTLYTSGVLYKIELDTEIWQDIPTTLARKFGDCEDLAMWRCAELQAQGIGAMPYITWRDIGGSDGKGRTIYHALVRHPDGAIEDPSRALGMHGHPITRAPVIIGYDTEGL